MHVQCINTYLMQNRQIIGHIGQYWLILNSFKSQCFILGQVKVMVLYPEHGISEIQKMQMKTVEGRGVHVVGKETVRIFQGKYVYLLYTTLEWKGTFSFLSRKHLLHFNHSFVTNFPSEVAVNCQ